MKHLKVIRKLRALPSNKDDDNNNSGCVGRILHVLGIVVSVSEGLPLLTLKAL